MPACSRDSEADLSRSCSCVHGPRASVELRGDITVVKRASFHTHWFDWRIYSYFMLTRTKATNLNQSHMLKRVLDDYGFGNWKSVSGKIKYRTRSISPAIASP